MARRVNLYVPGPEGPQGEQGVQGPAGAGLDFVNLNGVEIADDISSINLVGSEWVASETIVGQLSLDLDLSAYSLVTHHHDATYSLLGHTHPYVLRAGDTMTGNLEISNNLPGIWVEENDAAANEKETFIGSIGGKLVIQFNTDDFGTTAEAMSIDRTGVTPAAPKFAGLAGTGQRIMQSDANGQTLASNTVPEIIISGTAPSLHWYESDAAADEKYWKIYPDAGVWRLQTINDASSSSSDVMSFDRSGTTPTAPTFAALAGTNDRAVETSSAGLLSAARYSDAYLLDYDAFTGISVIDWDGIFTTTFDVYEIEYYIQQLSNAGATFSLQFRASGSTQAGADYFAGYTHTSNTTSSGGAWANASTLLQMSHSAGAGLTFGISGNISLYRPAATRVANEPLPFVIKQSQYRTGTDIGGGFFVGGWIKTTAVDGFRFTTSAGTFTNGKVWIYGKRRTM